MYVKELQLSNFRGFESLTLQFHEQLTVLVGVNGSGKTSVLDAVGAGLGPIVKSRVRLSAQDVRVGSPAAAIQIAVDATFGTEARAFSVGCKLDVAGTVNHTVVPSSRRIDERPVPVVVYFTIGRQVRDKTPGALDPSAWSPREAWSLGASLDFDDFFRWFREREDLENQDIRDNPSHRDSQLTAVRDAVSRALPGYAEPRIRRSRTPTAQPVLVLNRSEGEFALDQLSDGERILFITVADIARRLCIANDADPLEGKGVVLIDEIELHLHPKWQAEIILALRRTFPNLQFIVTTHSPIVLSRVPSECIRVLEDFKVYDAPGKTEGRDPNALLLEVFDTPLRPDEVTAQLREIGDLIDADDLEGARKVLDALAESLGERDAEVTRLRTMLSVLAS